MYCTIYSYSYILYTGNVEHLDKQTPMVHIKATLTMRWRSSRDQMQKYSLNGNYNCRNLLHLLWRGAVVDVDALLGRNKLCCAHQTDLFFTLWNNKRSIWKISWSLPTFFEDRKLYVTLHIWIINSYYKEAVLSFDFPKAFAAPVLFPGGFPWLLLDSLDARVCAPSYPQVSKPHVQPEQNTEER